MGEIQTFVGAAQKVIDSVQQVVLKIQEIQTVSSKIKEIQTVASKVQETQTRQGISKSQANEDFWNGVFVSSTFFISGCILYAMQPPKCKVTHKATLEEIEEAPKETLEEAPKETLEETHEQKN